MGQLVEGVWRVTTKKPASKSGRFVRANTQFRNWITADGSPGPSGVGGFKAEPGRYHLTVSHACPWAHRTLILRKLKGLEGMISLAVVHWHMGKDGWGFEPGPGVVPDPILGARRLHELYCAAERNHSGRASVPLLWDKSTATIVSNESSEIIRMFNSAFDGVGALPGDFYPQALRAEVDEINARVYGAVNNGVYMCGFARTQEAYDNAVTALFETLDYLEERLARQRYLTGGRVTEADWRLFTTLVRFDAVYHGHFKCNIRRLVDYPNLWNYTRELYQTPGVAETVDLFHNKQHYYGSHESINPTRIVPKGPAIDFTQPHDRERLPSAASSGRAARTVSVSGPMSSA